MVAIRLYYLQKRINFVAINVQKSLHEMVGEMEPFVSVIIAAYNAEATLEETLLSVFGQGYKNYEVLVYNDGSTDSTNLILDKYADRIKFYAGANKGVSYARNYLIDNSKGEYIALLDADDVWHPKYLQYQIQMLQKHDRAGLMLSRFLSFRDIKDLHSLMSETPDLLGCSFCSPLALMKIIQRQSLIIQASFVLIRRSALSKLSTPFFPEDLQRCEDRYFWYSLLLKGVVFCCLDMPLGGYRFSENGLSADQLSIYLDEAKAHKKLLSLPVEAKHEPLVSEIRRQLTASYRQVGKLYMGIDDKKSARYYFSASLLNKVSTKSLIMLLLTFMPKWAQPRWPKRQRSWR